MTSKRNTDVVASIETNELVRKAIWGLIQGVGAQRTFAEMLIHSESMEESDAPTAKDIAHMVAGMAECLDLHLNHVKDFVFDQVGRARS